MFRSKLSPDVAGGDYPGVQFPENLHAITRPQASVPVLVDTKLKLWTDFLRGVSPNDLAKMYELRVWEVWLVIHQVQRWFLYSIHQAARGGRGGSAWLN